MRTPITDHRARPVRFRVLIDDQLRVVKDDAMPADRRERIEQRLRKALLARTSNLRLASAMVGVVGILGIFLLGPPRWAAALAIVVMVLANIVLGAIQIARLHRRYGAAIIAAFLAERCCPTCGYDLNGAKVGEDGCTACPECGAAWRLESPTSRPPSSQ